MQHRTIVVVDDSTDFLAFIETLLAWVGYTVLSCQRSTEAMALIHRHHPTVAMLDIRMEHFDSGFALLSALRADAATTGLPVLLCSADVEALRAFEATNHEPHTAVLTKPFEFHEVLQVLQRIQEHAQTYLS